MAGGMSSVMALMDQPSLLTLIPDYLHANFRTIAELGALPDKLTFHGASLPANFDANYMFNFAQNTLLVFALGIQNLSQSHSLSQRVMIGELGDVNRNNAIANER
jgi:hypothetical protein